MPGGIRESFIVIQSICQLEQLFSIITEVEGITTLLSLQDDDYSCYCVNNRDCNMSLSFITSSLSIS